MPSYLVESYAPAASAPEAEAAIARLADDEQTIRYLRTSFVPADETCFHLVEAGSLEAVRAALARADISYERIVETLEFDADRGTDVRRLDDRLPLQPQVTVVVGSQPTWNDPPASRSVRQRQKHTSSQGGETR